MFPCVLHLCSFPLSLLLLACNSALGFFFPFLKGILHHHGHRGFVIFVHVGGWGNKCLATTCLLSIMLFLAGFVGLGRGTLLILLLAWNGGVDRLLDSSNQLGCGFPPSCCLHTKLPLL